ncbi:MAG: competence damage-inducible protein A [Zestosphaera tikiterensis]|uniref:Competence damage-inducible protein A n=1 Tax=Zestosphaera tikiterensis TaxID=1973259 RepID=A0A2R7Y407_9CREN|nr:MAG: competence damage-inducible protein A [Zestosphaera tikiterensis]
MNAWVFTLGNEVVHGRVLNTNAAYIGRRLTLLGFNVLGNISLIDDVNLISEVLRYVLSLKPRLIVTTGGLGPTYDDRTLEAIAKALDRKLVLNQAALAMIKSKYDSIGLPLTNERVKMALMPEDGVPIHNPIGTAPGCFITVGETLIFSLPGVPQEMEAMWESYVEPKLKSLGVSKALVETTFTVVGIPESTAAKAVVEVLKDYPSAYVKTHPKGYELGKPVLDVYILVSDADESKAAEVLDNIVAELKQKLRELGGMIP